MRVEFFAPDSVTEPRHWVRHEEGLAMMLGPGSIEWGSKRSSMELTGQTVVSTKNPCRLRCFRSCNLATVHPLRSAVSRDQLLRYSFNDLHSL